MQTITKVLKESILEGCKLGIVYSRNDIKQVIKEQTGLIFGVEYQETHFAGALATLVKKGQLVSTGRGNYRLADSDECESGGEKEEGEEKKERDISEIIYLAKKSLSDEYKYLKDIMSGVKLSWNDLNKKDIEDMLFLKETLEYLEKSCLL